MSGTIASVAYQQSQLTAAANAAAAGLTNTGASANGAAAGSTSSPTGSPAGSTASTTSSSGGALGALANNYNDFLTMLTTQLKNQDPSSPMDSSQFTSELVQFSSVEQQINTNSSLGQLIQLTQAGDLTQASAMLGSQVTATSSQVPLQNGKASLSFNAPAAEPVAIAVYNGAGTQILDTALTATQGSNTWNWNGKDASGTTVPDGAYTVAVMGQGTNGTPTALPFTVTGTATGVSSSGNAVKLNLGTLSVPFTAVTSVTKAGSTAGG
ncbi:flagellar biosynthesis protein FlgD [Acidiphilium sp. PA]|uniref:flagellar hook assembly protein FlgD n=1 Tax=Acidiphilium sp. PA TaxID=2871705 RepID=UPI00224416CC|nr:flagellar hook capping FlgD N-terminal domain-containing protein [Acidiphilium sp. PA]MCW8307639.1 flagellar biosynthesis protein FlgD [Acidiphilium sp. PA]